MLKLKKPTERVNHIVDLNQIGKRYLKPAICHWN
jgi:hypothetical protein